MSYAKYRNFDKTEEEKKLELENENENKLNLNNNDLIYKPPSQKNYFTYKDYSNLEIKQSEVPAVRDK